MIGAGGVRPTGLNVEEVLDVDDEVLFAAAAEDPAERQVYAGGPGGTARLTREPGVHHAARQGNLMVTSSRSLRWFGPRVRAWRDGKQAGEIRSLAETPVLAPEVTFLTAGAHELRCALLLPRGHRRGSARLPVLCDPYGRPTAQPAVRSPHPHPPSPRF